MSIRSQRAIAASCAALAMLLSPLPLGGVPYLFSMDAYAASKAGNHGRGGGNGGGGGSEHSNSGGNSSTHGPAAKAAVVSPPADPSKSGHGNLHSKLAGLNSLNRNINGLMNSADPKMVEIRAFVQASAELAAAQIALTAANETLGTAQSNYDALVGSFGLTAFDGDPNAYSDTSLGGLQQRLADLNAIILADPSNLAAADEANALALAIETVTMSGELAALQAAQTEVATQTAAVTAGLAATTDEMLIEALMVAANDNRVAEYGDGYVDPALLDWAKQRLGVGDYDGLIDAYIASL